MKRLVLPILVLAGGCSGYTLQQSGLKRLLLATDGNEVSAAWLREDTHCTHHSADLMCNEGRGEDFFEDGYALYAGPVGSPTETVPTEAETLATYGYWSPQLRYDAADGHSWQVLYTPPPTDAEEDPAHAFLVHDDDGLVQLDETPHCGGAVAALSDDTALFALRQSDGGVRLVHLRPDGTASSDATLALDTDTPCAVTTEAIDVALSGDTVVVASGVGNLADGPADTDDFEVGVYVGDAAGSGTVTEPGVTGEVEDTWTDGVTTRVLLQRTLWVNAEAERTFVAVTLGGDTVTLVPQDGCWGLGSAAFLPDGRAGARIDSSSCDGYGGDTLFVEDSIGGAVSHTTVLDGMTTLYLEHQAFVGTADGFVVGGFVEDHTDGDRRLQRTTLTVPLLAVDAAGTVVDTLDLSPGAHLMDR